MTDKIIVLPVPNKKVVATEKPKRQRKIAEKKPEWFQMEDSKDECRYLYEIPDKLLNQIRYKLQGYKSQDYEKGIYSSDEFIDISGVIEKMVECRLNCFYCKNPCMLFYEYVRESTQWTLDRMDNSLGHNKKNVEIACLKCNLRRKTMHHDRYVKTKQMTHIRLLSSED